MLTSVFIPNRFFWFICACVFVVYMYIATGGGGGQGVLCHGSLASLTLFPRQAQSKSFQ